MIRIPRMELLRCCWAMPAFGLASGRRSGRSRSKLCDVDKQWLCDGPYRTICGCVKFRSPYWVDGFFECIRSTLRIRRSMVATQSAANPPVPRAAFPAISQQAVRCGDTRLSRSHRFQNARLLNDFPSLLTAIAYGCFVRQNGVWRPGAAALFAPVIPPSGRTTRRPRQARRARTKSWKRTAEDDQKWIEGESRR